MSKIYDGYADYSTYLPSFSTFTRQSWKPSSPAQLFRFDSEKYEELKKRGFNFEL